MASLSLCPQFETNLMSNRKVNELLLQLKSAKAHGKNYIKVKPHLVLVRHLLRNRLLKSIAWVLPESCHNRIVRSPHENYFNVCWPHKEKIGLARLPFILASNNFISTSYRKFLFNFITFFKI